MSLWGGKGASPDVVAEDSRIKDNLIEELSRALKAVEKEHIHSEDPIQSSDSVNAMCNVLEAVFLHGLKRGFKISNFLGGNVKSSDVNFWGFLVKCTHKDVVSQLNHLGQITTEVGFCRAWIRMAINDGLIESYLDAMLADAATLKTYYRNPSFLRDAEKPGILKTYLQGLSNFMFQLSYNSSVLNMWPNISLMLSGLLDPRGVPSAVVASKSDSAIVRKTSSAEIIGTEPVKARSTSSKNIKQATLQPIQGQDHFDSPYHSDLSNHSSREQTAEPSTPHNTPYDPSLLNTRDSDVIQKMALLADNGAKTDDLNVDVVPGTPPNTPYDPSLLKTKDADEIKLLTVETERAVKGGATRKAMKKKRKKKEKSHEKVDLLRGEDRLVGSGSMPGPPPNSPFDHSMLHSDNIDDIRKMTIEVEKLGTSSGSDVSCPDDERRRNLHDSDGLGKQSSGSGSSVNSTNVYRFRERRKSETSASMSDVIASHVKLKSSDASNGSKKAVDKMRDAVSGSFNVEVIMPENGDDIDDLEAHIYGHEAMEDTTDDDLASLGNKLGEMGGWSSAFEQSQEYTVREKPTVGKETYDSLLQNYEPSSSSVSTSATVSQVISHLSDEQTSMMSEEQIQDDMLQSRYYTTGLLRRRTKKTQGMLSIISDICNEQGLDVQNFQCQGCMKPIGLIYGKCRVCTYDGCYYCLECHDNDEYYIPSRIVHNWDFRKHKVSKDNKCFLIQVQEEPVLNLRRINPLLYEHVEEMMEVYVIRQQLRYLKSYLFTCKQSVADDFRKKVWPKEYLFEHIHLYSLADLLQVFTGQLASILKKVVKHAAKHVYSCSLCSQKGFFCEICDNPKVIYPFEVETTVQCLRCKAVYHKECKTDMKPCPKCQRRLSRKSTAGISDLKTPDGIDFACVPGEENVEPS
ncbi:uncharacterized protein LOC135497000 isoform X2 [Lineus longissimus]|uniref:uncharacterized protein LOC135497000 isoform X2 n=1 Tax=Lineus longissimus TaxID=88925 RepID=UPI00315C6AF0